MTQRIPTALLLLSCVTIGCTAEPEPLDEQLGENSGASCMSTPTVLASVDEVSSLGFAAADVLAFAAGEHESPLFWHDQSADDMVEVGPESGESSLSVNISHQGGEIRFIDSEPAEDGGFEGEFSDCPDRLEIDVMAEIGSGGGALAEAVPVTLSATHDLLARFSASIEPEAIAGSMVVTSTDPAFDVGTIDFDVGISSYGLSGSITGMISAIMGDIAVAGSVEYAVFPSEEQPCSSSELALPLDADLLGFSGADALALINRAWIFQWTWQGGEPIDLSLSAAHDGNSVCASLVPDQANRLVFGATITLATGDGVVNAAFPVVVTAEADEEGALAQVQVYNDSAYLLGNVADFAETFGEFGVDVSAYDRAGIEFSGSFVDNDAPGSADGSLTVLGGIDPNCSNEPGEPCEGVEVTEVASAQWGNTGVAP